MAQLTPQQLQQFQLMQQMNQSMQPTLSYQQWLAQRGAGNPYAPVPQQPAQQGPDIGSILNSLGSGSAGGAVGSQIGIAGATPTVGPLATPSLFASEASPFMTAAGEGSFASGAGATGIGANAAGMGILPLAAIAAGTVLGGKAGYDMLKGKKPGLPGRIVLGMATGGLSEVANKFLNKKSIKDKMRDNTEDLLGQSDDPTYQALVRGMREQYKTTGVSGPPDPEHPFGDTKGNKYKSWDEYKKAGLDAANLTGVKGNLEFGPEYAKLNFDQQKALTQAFIDAGLYTSKKGEVELTDKMRGQNIFDKFKETGFDASKLNAVPRDPTISPPPQMRDGMYVVGRDGPAPSFINKLPSANMPSTISSAAPTMPPPIMIPRSKTSSPGISKTGQRISYGRV